jgi:hypothetical protein
VGEAVDVAGAEYKGAAQLEGIGAEFVLVVAGGAGALAAFEIVASEEMENVGGFEVGDFVGLAMLVDEQGEVDACFLLEDSGVGWLVFAQLRDVLAAKDSAVVAEEDKDGGIGFPEGAEADGFADGVGERDICKLLAEGYEHDGP